MRHRVLLLAAGVITQLAACATRLDDLLPNEPTDADEISADLAPADRFAPDAASLDLAIADAAIADAATVDASLLDLAPAESPPIWPMYRHDAQRTSASDFAVSPNAPHVAWMVGGGTLVGECPGPTVGADGTIYITTLFDLLAFSAVDGRMLWSIGDGTSTWCGATLGRDGTIYSVSDSAAGMASVVAISPSTHGELWRVPLSWKGNAYRASPQDALIGPDDTFYVPVGDPVSLQGVVALDTHARATRWLVDISGSAAIALHASSLIFHTTGWNPGMGSLDAHTGTSQWLTPWGPSNGASSSTVATPMASPSGQIYIADDSGKLGLLSYAADGQPLWQVQGPWANQLVLSKQGIAYGWRNRALVAFDATTGQEQWEYTPSGGAVLEVGAADVNGIVLITTASNSGFAVEAIRPDSSLQWHVDIGQVPFANPIIGPAGRLYVLQGGNLTALDP